MKFHNVPESVVKDNLEKFQKEYEGFFYNQHGHKIETDFERAFEVLYMAGGLDACRRKSILENKGESNKKHKESRTESGRDASE